MFSKVQQAFFALVRSGLWEQEVQLAPYGEIDFAEVLWLSVEYLGLPLSVYVLLFFDDDSTGLSQVGENLKSETWNKKPSLRRKARQICREVLEAGNLTSSTSVTTRQSSSELGSVLAAPSV